MKVNYFIGCSGWYYNNWAGKFYPERGSKSNGWDITLNNSKLLKLITHFTVFQTKKKWSKDGTIGHLIILNLL